MSTKINESRIMNCGEEATIIELNNYDDITVEFKKYNEVVKHCKYSS